MSDIDVAHEVLPNDNKEVEEIILKVDKTTFGDYDWNNVVMETKSLAAEWEEISICLGLSFDLIKGIKSDAVDCYKRWSNALNQWIKQNYNTKKFGDPSWRTLLKAIAGVDKRKFKKLAAAHQESKHSDSSGEAPCEAKAQVDESVKVHACSLPHDKDKAQHTFHCIDLVKMNKEEKQQLYQKLYAESEDMMYKFQDLFTSTTDSLRSREVHVRELTRHLECLGHLKPTFKDSSEPALKQQLPQLKTMEFIDDAMSVVKNYCSFFNYRMLEHLIQKIGSQQDKENLAKYKVEFAKYGERHVFECPSEVAKIHETGHANMFVTLDEAFDDCSVNHLSAFVSNLQKVLNIPNLTLRLCHISPGSLRLTFQLPHFVQQAIFPLSYEQEAALSDLGVVQLSCGDYQFSRHEKQKQESQMICGADLNTKETLSSRESQRDAELTSVSGMPRHFHGDMSDSALGRSSVVSGTTAEVTQFSEDSIKEEREFDDLTLKSGQNMTSTMKDNDLSYLELHLASLNGELDKVKQLIEEKHLNPVQKFNKYGMNAMHYAAMGGHQNVMTYFIEEQGCNAACGDQNDATPLHYAVRHRHLQLIKYLVEKQQVEPFCRDENGCTALHVACASGSIEVIHYLAIEMSRYLPMNEVVNDKDYGGCSPLHHSALWGQLEACKLLISKFNCNPNIVSDNGKTSVHAAADGGNLQVMQYLIEQQHCDPSSMDAFKTTPLHMAAGKGHLDIVKYLTLEQHCDSQCSNNIDKINTPLHSAALYGQLEVVKFFVESLQCSPNVRGRHDKTPLELAHSQGHQAIVKYLVNYLTLHKLHVIMS